MNAYFLSGHRPAHMAHCISRHFPRAVLTYRCLESGDPVVRIRSRYVPSYPEVVDTLDVYIGLYGEFESPAHRAWVYANLFWRDHTMSPVLVILGKDLSLMGLQRYFKSYVTVWCDDPGEFTESTDLILPRGSTIGRLHPVVKDFVDHAALMSRPRIRAFGY